MKIHDVPQNSLDWLNLHVGLPTASGMSNLLTPGFELRKGEMPKAYVARKVAEAYRDQPLIGFTAPFAVEQGLVVEEEARPFFELETGIKLKTVGFITRDDDSFGCSPDALFADDSGTGVEIKCPMAETQVRYLVNGVIPPDYLAQVYSSMYATDAPSWWFMSYRRRFPALILKVDRDEAIMGKIEAALAAFHAEFDRAMARVKSFEEYSPFR